MHAHILVEVAGSQSVIHRPVPVIRHRCVDRQRTILGSCSYMNLGQVGRALFVFISAALLYTHAVASSRENRCGWLQNPTPANWWLDDKDGSWTLSVMGGRPVPGFDDLPDMTSGDWVVTNAGGHGYGCACIDMDVDKGTGKVVRLHSAKVLPLRRCKADRSLPPP
jgi:hypothetical protein